MNGSGISAKHSGRYLGQTSSRGNASVNVGTLERLGSATVGALLIISGVKRHSVLGTALAVTGGELVYRGLTGHCHLYGSIGMSTADGDRAADGMRMQQSVTINKTPDELYRAWRQPENLTRVMEPLAEVTPAGEDRTHWAMNTPLGRKIEWDAQIVEDRPGELLRWHSNVGATEGSVSFRSASQDWGSTVTLSLRFQPPGGEFGRAVVKQVDFVPRMVAHKVLQRFKSLVETGEIPTLRKNPTARKGVMANAF